MFKVEFCADSSRLEEFLNEEIEKKSQIVSILNQNNSFYVIYIK